eukprot:scaffold84043_cov16-Prasinocladus_malaysianus.AAC.2
MSPPIYTAHRCYCREQKAPYMHRLLAVVIICTIAVTTKGPIFRNFSKRHLSAASQDISSLYTIVNCPRSSPPRCEYEV